MKHLTCISFFLLAFLVFPYQGTTAPHKVSKSSPNSITKSELKKHKKESLRIAKSERRKNRKEFRKNLREMKDGLPIWAKIALTVLVDLLLMFGLCALLILSFVVAMGTSLGLGLVILIVSATALIVLTVFVNRKIWKGSRRRSWGWGWLFRSKV